MDDCGVERAALALTHARLGKLKQYEGCRVRICLRESRDCWNGILEEIDETAATATLRDVVDGSLLILTLDPNDWELQVYNCPGGA